MKEEITNEKNENGLYSKTTVKEKTPEDGFVCENKAHISTTRSETSQLGHYVWHKGYAKKISYTTNDPRIAKLFVYTVCGVFFTIGIVALLLHSWFFGICFTSVAIFAFGRVKKDLDDITENLKNEGYDVTKDSKEVRKEFTETIKNNFDDVKTSTFTKEHFKWFAKCTIPIYCVITIITSLCIAIFLDVVLGLIVLGICILVGLFYYYIVSKICKY